MDWRILDKESDSLLSIVVGRRDVEGGAPVVKVAHDAASIAQVGSRPDGRLMVGGEKLTLLLLGSFSVVYATKLAYSCA